MSEKKKPMSPIIGSNGNIFNLLGIASRTLKENGMAEEASRDFDEIRKLGTGLSTVLSQHFIQSFSPGEITPEQALQVGKEMCERFLKGEYQYFLAVHNDRDHIHLHVILIT